ncbi:MAG: FAD-dependent oxidoreductase [Planctomycetota bacterium]
MADPVAIIGAGPAGCAAAITLARAGVPVTLVEAKRFPRAKVCGEFVSPAATEVLEGLLPIERLVGAGARRCTALEVRVGERSVRWAMPRPAWVLSRRALDAALCEEAGRAGVEVRQPARVERVVYHDACAEVWLASGEVIRASCVMHGDGRGRFDHPSGPGVTASRAGVVGLKCHVRAPGDVPTSTLVMHAARGGYFGVIGVEGGEATVAMVVRDRLVRARVSSGSRDEAIDRVMHGLAPATSSYERVGPWMACPVAGSRYRAGGHVRSVRLGNAAGAVEPVGGEGIGLALWSGATAGGLLGEGWREDGRLDAGRLASVWARFGALYRERLRWRLPACRVAASILERPALAGVLLPMLGVADARPLGVWYRLTGKPGGCTPIHD